MKHALVSFCLSLAAVFANTPYLYPMDVALRTANCLASTETVVAATDWHEVHAVVVDMPRRASLEYASPETWGALPTFDPPNEEAPTKPVLQVALN
jgi:hypothetical protein